MKSCDAEKKKIDSCCRKTDIAHKKNARKMQNRHQKMNPQKNAESKQRVARKKKTALFDQKNHNGNPRLLRRQTPRIFEIFNLKNGAQERRYGRENPFMGTMRKKPLEGFVKNFENIIMNRIFEKFPYLGSDTIIRKYLVKN